MAGIDLSNVLDQITQLGSGASTAAAEATSAVQANTAALTSSFQQSVDRQEVVAANTQVVADVQNQGKLVGQNALQNFSAQWGGDTADASGQQARLAARHNQASQAADDALDIIRQKRSVSFFDDPLSWISNKMTINTDIDNYNSNVTIANKAESDMDSINASIDLRAQAQAKIATTVTAASAQAASQIAVASAQEAADVLARQGIAANTQGVSEIANMSYRQMQIATAGFDADAKYQELKASQAHLALAYSSFDLEQKRFDLMQSKEVNADGANQYIAEQINSGLKVMFPNNPAAWNVPAGKISLVLSGKFPMDPVLAQAFKVGESSKDYTIPGAGTRLLGVTPSDALKTLSFNPTVSPDMAGGIGILNQAKQLVDKRLAGQPITTPAQQKEYDDAVNNQANTILMAAANHTNDPTSVYYLPSADKIVAAIPELQQDPVWKTVLAPMLAAKADLSNPAVVAGYVSQAVQSGTITLNQGAASLNNLYQRGQEMNIASKQLVGLGLTPKVSYLGPDPYTGVGAVGKINYVDAVEVKAALMRMSASNGNIFTNAQNVAP